MGARSCVSRLGAELTAQIAVQLENELDESPLKRAHIEDLRDTMRRAGIVVPLTLNDADSGVREHRLDNINGTLYGLDAYPFGFDCARPQHWEPVQTGLQAQHRAVNPHQPLSIPEFQAGAFDPWGPHSPGYDSCRQLTGRAFTQVFNLAALAENVKCVLIAGCTDCAGC